MKKLEQKIFKRSLNMKLKNISVDLKIKNIDELKALVKELDVIVDKIQNFKFDIEASQCEHIQDKHH